MNGMWESKESESRLSEMETKEEISYQLDVTNGIFLRIREIGAKKPALAVLAVLSVAIIAVPLVAVVSFASSGEGIPFGFVLSCVAAVLVSGYLARLYLWNRYGEEVFLLRDGQLSYYCDYRLFRDNRLDCRYKSVSVYCMLHGKPRKVNRELAGKLSPDEKSVIGFRVNGDFICSKNEIPLGVIIEVARCLGCFRWCNV